MKHKTSKIVYSTNFALQSLLLILTCLTSGASAQSDSIYVNSSGNVGIGTSSPVEKVDVWGNLQSYGSDRKFTFRVPGYSETHLGQIIALGDNSGGEWIERAGIRFTPTYAGWTRGGNIDFYTKLAGGGFSSSLKVRIDDQGDLISYGPERKMVFNVNGYSETFLGQLVALGDNSGGEFKERAAIRFTSTGPAWNRGSHIDFYTKDYGTGVSQPRVRVTSAGSLEVSGAINVGSLPSSGGEDVCRDGATGMLVNCSASAMRYKTNIQGYRRGLDVISNLNPVTFQRGSDSAQDVGLIAEEVAKIEPLLATYNADSKVDGVKYRQISVILINAIREQQVEITEMRKQLAQLRADLNR